MLTTTPTPSAHHRRCPAFRQRAPGCVCAPRADLHVGDEGYTRDLFGVRVWVVILALYRHTALVAEPSAPGLPWPVFHATIETPADLPMA